MTSARPRPHVHIYCDGACSPNPGRGGWGVVLLAPDLHLKKELSGAEDATTNNQMELRAAIEGLAALKTSCRVDLYTDSTYVMNAFEKRWIPRWQKNGWRTKQGEPVKNEELWRTLAALTERHEVRWHWVRGHDGNKGNERADALAVAARLRR